ncbi:MAG: PEP-CTERM sorting domain-containing protein [Verrucomicrobiae bacterium]|nr:PEP-CTERM sorting domain-containing protein [Verrucomicrobiae bacterium]
MFRNDLPQIVSFSFGITGVGDGVLVDDLKWGVVAVPEPSTTALLGLSAITLLMRRRRS